MFWTWVSDAALRVKDRELAKGWDKDGNVHPLRPKTIRYRKSEVGPVTRTAPRLIPALALSRVRSLLRGRAHHQSAELYWDFDAVTGDSFAVILHFAAEQGHDVFGISPRGTAQIKQEAINKWQAWKEQAGHARPSVSVPGFPGPPRVTIKREVKRPIAKQEVKGRMDPREFRPEQFGRQVAGGHQGRRVHRVPQVECARRAVAAWDRDSTTMISFNLADCGRFAARIKRLDLTRGDMTPLLKNWERLMEAGNRAGILAGSDGKGQPMIAVTYRPVGPARKKPRSANGWGRSKTSGAASTAG